MHSPDKPGSDIPGRILAATLTRVRQGRAKRRNLLTATASFALMAVSLGWWIQLSPRKSDGGPVISQSESIQVERVAERSLRLIQRSSQLSTSVERIAELPGDFVQIVVLTDEQLLASLPPEQSAALVKNPDGSSRLFVLQ